MSLFGSWLPGQRNTHYTRQMLSRQFLKVDSFFLNGSYLYQVAKTITRTVIYLGKMIHYLEKEMRHSNINI